MAEIGAEVCGDVGELDAEMIDEAAPMVMYMIASGVTRKSRVFHVRTPTTPSLSRSPENNTVLSFNAGEERRGEEAGKEVAGARP